MTVAVPFSADPNAVIDAFRRIQEEARKTGRELKSLGDVDFPGLEGAKKQLQDMQTGFQQLFAPAVRGGAAESLRSGARAGMYEQDIVSWMQGAQRQFPDPAALNRHIQQVLTQSGRIAGMGPGGGQAAEGGGGGWGGYSGPGAGAVVGGLMSGNIGGVAGGAIGGIFGPLGAVIGAGIGSKLQGSIGKYAELSMQESYGMTDLRRSSGGIGDSFEEFSKKIRDAGGGLVTFTEGLQAAKAYAQLSGVVGGTAVAAGTNESVLLARRLGLDPSQAAGMLGRASWMGMNGGDVHAQARMLGEAMAGSGLGARQADAADAIMKFVEQQNQSTGGNGNVEAFRGLLLTLYGSGNPGIKTNAANIIGGYDAAIKGGGGAGDAGKNFMYRTLSPDGKMSPYEFDYALEGGFFGQIGGKGGQGGKMIGPALIDAILARTGGDTFTTSASMKGLFNGNQHLAQAFMPEYMKWRADPNRTDLGLREAYDKSVKDFGKGGENDADKLRAASAHLENAATALMGDHVLSLFAKTDETLAKLAEAINKMTGGAPEGELLSAENPATIGKIRNAVKAGGGNYKTSASYRSFLHSIEQQHHLPMGSLYGIMGAESSFGDHNHLVSGSGALGPFQFMEAAAAEVGLKNRMSAVDSAMGTGKYLENLRKRHPTWSFDKILTAYHSGEGNVAAGRIGPDGAAYAGRVHNFMKQDNTIHVIVDVVHKDEKGRVLKKESKAPVTLPYPSAKPH